MCKKHTELESLVPFLYNLSSYSINIVSISVDKMVHMLGSYPPKKNIQSYITPSEETPSGLMARGTYTITSLFSDDDKNEHLKWEWSFEIKKDW